MRLIRLLGGAIMAACAARTPAVVESPVAPDPVTALPFPAVPSVNGKLDLRVVYPAAQSLVPVADSNFIFGSTGSGLAELRINGQVVPVLPNGSFLGWLPVPAGDPPSYDLLVTRGADTLRANHPLRRRPPAVALPLTGPLVVDSGSLSPGPGLWRLGDDPVRVSLRAPANAQVLLLAGGRTTVLTPSAGRSVHQADVPASWLADSARLVVRRDGDTLSLRLPTVRPLDPGRLPLAEIGVAPSTLPDTDRVVIARPVNGGTYKWFLQSGTLLPVTGRSAEAWRLRLDRQLDVWVDRAEGRETSPGTLEPSRVVGNGRVRPSAGWSDVILPIAAPPAWSVDVESRTIVLTLHGATANTDIINYASGDSLVDHVTWTQEGEGRARYVVHLREPAWGYLARWERGNFTLRIRRAPRVDRQRPLAGIVVAVDAGHPPAGSTGPTGLYEAVATLAIAERTRALLEARGAQVVMTRTTPAALGLGERPMIARRAGAHVFVSIHLNALPDGVNPFRAHGTGTYYFTPWSAELARAVQWGMVRRMGLRDLGTNYDNLAVVRGTWMPSILCEGAFLMIPEQEAALRTAAFQEAYAMGVVEGLERWLRGVAAP